MCSCAYLLCRLEIKIKDDALASALFALAVALQAKDVQLQAKDVEIRRLQADVARARVEPKPQVRVDIVASRSARCAVGHDI
jgi:hypothetical protein